MPQSTPSKALSNVHRTVWAFVFLCALAACGGGTEDAPAAGPTSTSATSATTSQTATSATNNTTPQPDAGEDTRNEDTSEDTTQEDTRLEDVANDTPESDTQAADTLDQDTQESDTSPPEDTSPDVPPDEDTSQDTAPDVPDFEPGGECDPVAQDCPTNDQGDAQQCVPIEGVPTCIRQNTAQRADGEACDGGDCAPGLTCINWSNGRGQICTAMCDRNTLEGCSGDEVCSAWLRTNEAIGLCEPPPTECDIYAQDCPEDDQTCTFGRDPITRDPIFVCERAGTQEESALCGSGNGRCGRGLVCIRSGEEARCRAVCQEDAECAVDGETCSGRSTTWQATFCRP